MKTSTALGDDEMDYYRIEKIARDLFWKASEFDKESDVGEYDLDNENKDYLPDAPRDTKFYD